MNKFNYKLKNFKIGKGVLALGMTLSFLIGAGLFPAANAAAQYVTMQQRNKDLTDIARQTLALQRRISDLEFCIRNLRVSKYSSFGEVEC